ncbi:selenide, water dikinase SelD [candidate division WOR-3 bacterium]|nr:selenide, water dikinase SelD [candidate division WOR-3 bacterium]
MAQALAGLEQPEDPRLLVGINTADDAGVFLLTDGLALVQTVDLLTPMVEDPYTFGRIAAANSLSDVYAMGGEPLTVLNIVGFPAPLDKTILREILRGGQDTVKQAGAVVVGGHTFNEKEIKYGLAVTGRIDPKRIVTNAGAKLGDVLVLTKPLGIGVYAQAVMTLDQVDPIFEQAAKDSMMRLNRDAATIMVACEASAATDITGYGLLGHTQEMAEASSVRIRIYAERVPVLPRAKELAKTLIDPGVLMNENSFGKQVEWKSPVPDEIKNLLWESESSGGLLVALKPEKVGVFQSRAKEVGIIAPVIGEVVQGQPGTIEIV